MSDANFNPREYRRRISKNQIPVVHEILEDTVSRQFQVETEARISKASIKRKQVCPINSPWNTIEMDTLSEVREANIIINNKIIQKELLLSRTVYVTNCLDLNVSHNSNQLQHFFHSNYGEVEKIQALNSNRGSGRCPRALIQFRYQDDAEKLFDGQTLREARSRKRDEAIQCYTGCEGFVIVAPANDCISSKSEKKTITNQKRTRDQHSVARTRLEYNTVKPYGFLGRHPNEMAPIRPSQSNVDEQIPIGTKITCVGGKWCGSSGRVFRETDCYYHFKCEETGRDRKVNKPYVRVLENQNGGRGRKKRRI